MITWTLEHCIMRCWVLLKSPEKCGFCLFWQEMKLLTLPLPLLQVAADISSDFKTLATPFIFA